ncbi:CoA ligase [Dendryphion nanum]|uniref:CoA ligase n=1 Tax=Dendryphion nanum TaxID=256645 RepID=A0A9P9I7X3_9PLEO|nr:CoA ligase [Dendryphion nanum]
MLFKSQSPNINLPKDRTLWSWLFETCLSKFDSNDLQGYTDVETKQHISYSQLRTYTEQLSTTLARSYGLREGDVVAIYNKNSIWYPVIALAAIRIGAVACGISPEYTVDELTYALNLIKAKMLFTASHLKETASKAATVVGINKDAVMHMGGERDNMKGIENLIRDATSLNDSVLAKPFQIPKDKTSHELCAYLCLSSGTTGLSKAVMISHANVVAQCLQVQQITPKDHTKVLAALPFYHITGIVHEVHLPIVLNAHVYVLPTYNLDTLLRTVSKNKIQELLIVPPILTRLVQDSETVSKYDLTAVKRFSSGAAPLPGEVLKLLEQRFPGTGFKQGYGMTETCSAITSHPPSKYAYKYAGSVGMLVGSTEAKIVNPNTGEEYGTGKSGEIWARGPQVAMGYLENPSATADTFDKDGFIHTGDIGEFDEEGLLTITDRMKEMIKVKGVGIAPTELENLLLGHPSVSDVAVCGIPDERAGERPKAFVVLQPSVSQSPIEVARNLLEYTKSKKARHKWIREVEILNEIPKSAAGKILRRKLREKHGKASGNIIVRDQPAIAKL